MDHISWKGFIRLSLVTFPVRAYSAAAPASEQITLHQLHDSCHSRIRYQKVCPIHGEVPNNEIVKGYEYAKGEYVVIDPKELEVKTGEVRRGLEVRTFIHRAQLDPIYFAAKSYYLLPDAPNGGKPYALLRKVMTEENLCAISQIVLVSQEELMVLRAKDQLLTITELDYASQVRDPEPYAAEAPGDDFSAKELELTRTLVEATTTEEFDFHEYKDVREECFREMIEAKVAGKEIVTPPTEQPQVVINLMEALRESLKKTGKPRGKVMPKHKPVPKAARRSPARKKKRA